MGRWNERHGWLCGVAGVVALLAAPPAAAQDGSLFERLNLDRLRLTALGVSAGAVQPTKMLPTTAFTLFADYGEITPRWRVVFTATYWGSRYTDEVVRAFADSLRRVLIDPAGDDTLRLGRITVSDIAIGVDLRWTPRSGRVRPYIGGATMAHVVNAEGRVIDGTFVENALDSIAAGVAALTGLDVTLVRHLGVGMEVRYDLTSGVRYGSVRAVGSYQFDLPAGGATR